MRDVVPDAVRTAEVRGLGFDLVVRVDPVGAQPPAIAQTKIEGTADDEYHIRFIESGAARAAKMPARLPSV